MDQQHPNPNDKDSAAKRAAFAGQWRTPPLPVFPTNNNSHETTTLEQQSAPPNQQQPQMLPSSTEDYVKALQEAYLRGAEAAAALAQQQQTMNASCPDFATQSVPNPLFHPATTTTTTTSSTTASTTSMPPPQPRSLSMNELYSPPPPQQLSQFSPEQPPLQPHPHEEELKRQKRLARNRASARLRRLRKKNLVDAYESEVGALEQTLQKLKQHVWGHPESDAALLEALSMERGQQELNATQRQQAAMEIVQQQVHAVQLLQEMMQEQYILYQVAQNNEDPEWQELSQLLHLTPEQKEVLQAQAAGWHEEYQALQTVAESLQAMQDNHWLWNNGVAEIAEQFMNILHKNQVSKFLSWADHNWDALDELDFTTTTTTTRSEPTRDMIMGPVFQFGVDSMPTDEK